MRNRTVTALATLVAALTIVAVSSAITYGVPDGNGHPEVGALLALQAYSDGTWAECSGTLIAPHCMHVTPSPFISWSSAGLRLPSPPM